jgi:hypothetical protein
LKDRQIGNKKRQNRTKLPSKKEPVGKFENVD